MHSIFFWNEWKKTYKYLYLFLLTIFFISIILYLISFFIGIKAVIDWDVKSQFDSVLVTADQFTRNLFNYSIDASNYLIKEKYHASDVKIIPVFSYIYFTLVVIGILVALTVLTRLELVLYAIGMGFFIFFLVYLHTELLNIFGSPSRKFIFAAILLYGGLSFYYQAYNETFSFFKRLLSFIALTILLGLVISFGSKTPDPFLYISNYGIVVPVILTIIFIISISFDIINGFLFITSSTKKGGKNSLIHFSIISVLYLTNLLLLYLRKKGIITGDFIYIDVFFIYSASSILGIWGVKKRTVLFNNMINVSHSSFIYISFAIISTATITYSFITGNDSLKETFEYAILYSHLGIGFVFFLYILYNFGDLFYKNISAYELVYKPRRMPFFLVRPLGIIIIMSLFFQSNFFAYKLAKSGYYNCIGDIYFYQEKYTEAKEVYEEAAIYADRSRRSNYCMASVLIKLNQKQAAREYYENSFIKYPSEYAYVNLGNLYIESDMFFPALFTLKEGIEKFPKSGALHNNLALLYSSKGIWDTTVIYLQRSDKYLKGNEVASSNLLWFLARKNLLAEADSILEVKNFPNDLFFQNNKLVLHNLKRESYSETLNENFLRDSLLNGNTYSYLFNYVINKLKAPENKSLEKINYYLKYEGNSDYNNELTFLKCLKLYYSGEKMQAIFLLQNSALIVPASSSLYYNKILGLWAMQQEAYDVAAENLKSAINFYDNETQLNYAIALLEAGRIKEGLTYLDQLKKSPDSETKLVCENLLMVFNTDNIEEVKNWEDAQKFHFLHFRKNDLSEESIMQIHYLFKEENFRLISTAEIMQYFTSKGNPERAQNLWNDISAAANQNDHQYAWGLANYQYLKLLEAQGNWKTLREAAEKISLNEDKETDRQYFYAVAEEGLGNIQEAEKKYGVAIKESPYNEAAILKSVSFYNKKNNAAKAYDILVKSIQLNPFSVNLQKAYALQALRMNLTTYAEDTLDKIKSLTGPEEYRSFKIIFDKEKAEAEKRFEEF